jgi:hypothetical protein
MIGAKWLVVVKRIMPKIELGTSTQQLKKIQKHGATCEERYPQTAEIDASQIYMPADR